MIRFTAPYPHARTLFAALDVGRDVEINGIGYRIAQLNLSPEGLEIEIGRLATTPEDSVTLPYSLIASGESGDSFDSPGYSPPSHASEATLSQEPESQTIRFTMTGSDAVVMARIDRSRPIGVCGFICRIASVGFRSEAREVDVQAILTPHLEPLSWFPVENCQHLSFALRALIASPAWTFTATAMTLPGMTLEEFNEVDGSSHQRGERG